MRLSPIDPEVPIHLADVDASADEAPRAKKLKRKLTDRLDRLEELQHRLYADGRYAVLVILQGRDAAGKDGTIRRVFGACNPQGCAVTSFKAPTALELRHDFLWRIHQAVPPHGMVGVFNRSHYEDVIAARVQGLVPKSVWKPRFDQINDFERMLTASHVVVLKFFLHVSYTEQRRRLLKRIEKRSKNWKFDSTDIINRKRWEDYSEAYHDVLRRCSTEHAPWYFVPADNKRVRDFLIADTIVRRLEKLGLTYPDADPNVLLEAEQTLSV